MQQPAITADELLQSTLSPTQVILEECGVGTKQRITDESKLRRKLYARTRKRDITNDDLVKITKVIINIEDQFHKMDGTFALDKKVDFTFSADTLNAILSGLPDEYARRVRQYLIEFISAQRNQ